MSNLYPTAAIIFLNFIDIVTHEIFQTFPVRIVFA